jgi:toxin YoeB
MRHIKFSRACFKDYVAWSEANPEIFNKINQLIKEIIRDPFKGLGKPEPLKNDWKGYWSRRIDDKHRLVYKVEQDAVIFAKCHGHYSD